MHLDLFTHEQAAEVHRLLGLGATYVRHNEDPDDDFVVLRDPEGNYLCVCALPNDQPAEVVAETGAAAGDANGPAEPSPPSDQG